MVNSPVWTVIYPLISLKFLSVYNLSSECNNRRFKYILPSWKKIIFSLFTYTNQLSGGRIYDLLVFFMIFSLCSMTEPILVTSLNSGFTLWIAECEGSAFSFQRKGWDVFHIHIWGPVISLNSESNGSNRSCVKTRIPHMTNLLSITQDNYHFNK